MLRIIFLFSLPLITLALDNNEGDSPNFCQMTVDCYELAAEQLAICESFQITVKAKNRSHPITQLASCKAELTEYKQQQKNLSHVRQTDFKNCLKTVNDLVKPVLHGKNCSGVAKNTSLKLLEFSDSNESSNSTGNKKASAKLQTERKKCMSHRENILLRCIRLRSCCSRSKICDEIYETNEFADTHLKIHQLTLRIIRKEAECENLRNMENIKRGTGSDF